MKTLLTVLTVFTIAVLGISAFYIGRASNSPNVNINTPGFVPGVGGGPGDEAIPTSTGTPVPLPTAVIPTDSPESYDYEPVRGEVAAMTHTSITVNELYSSTNNTATFRMDENTTIYDEEGNAVSFTYIQEGSLVSVDRYYPMEGAFQALRINVVRQ